MLSNNISVVDRIVNDLSYGKEKLRVFEVSDEENWCEYLGLDCINLCKSANTVVAFDFDGTLVDSYSCLWSIYIDIAEKLGIYDYVNFTEAMLIIEDVADYLKMYDKRKLWEDVLINILDNKIEIDEIIEFYWEERVNRTRLLYNVEDVVKKIKKMGVDVVLVASCDDTVGRKLWRIKKAGIYNLFDDVVIYGCESNRKNLYDAIVNLLAQYDLVIYVDDKPERINIAKNIDKYKVIPIHHVYRPSFPRALSWQKQVESNVVRVSSLTSIMDLFSLHNGGVFDGFLVEEYKLSWSGLEDVKKKVFEKMGDDVCKLMFYLMAFRCVRDGGVPVRLSRSGGGDWKVFACMDEDDYNDKKFSLFYEEKRFDKNS